MLVDSSVWIDLLKGASNAETRLLVSAMQQKRAVWTAPPILQEVLQGADTPERFARWDDALAELPLLDEPDPRTVARDAAHLYARCRWKGITPRSGNDCLIAVYSIRSGVPLLHRDRDFIAIGSLESRLKLLAP